MKSLKENYRIFILLGICSPDKPIKYWMKLIYILISVFCAMVFVANFLSSFIYFERYISNDLADSICVVYQIIGAVIGFYSLVIAHVKRQNIKKIFENVKAFYNACKL